MDNLCLTVQTLRKASEWKKDEEKGKKEKINNVEE